MKRRRLAKIWMNRCYNRIGAALHSFCACMYESSEVCSRDRWSWLSFETNFSIALFILECIDAMGETAMEDCDENLNEPSCGVSHSPIDSAITNKYVNIVSIKMMMGREFSSSSYGRPLFGWIISSGDIECCSFRDYNLSDTSTCGC